MTSPLWPPLCSHPSPSGTPLPEPARLQCRLGRTRAVQRGPGGPRVVQRGTGPACVQLRPRTLLRARQLCQQLPDQRWPHVSMAECPIGSASFNAINLIRAQTCHVVVMLFLLICWFLNTEKKNCVKVEFWVYLEFKISLPLSLIKFARKLVCSHTAGASAFQAMPYLPHQQSGYSAHSHFTSQPGQFLSLSRLVSLSTATQWAGRRNANREATTTLNLPMY